MTPTQIKHFEKNDKKLISAVRKHHDLRKLKLTPSDDYFMSLCRIMIGQQVSVKAAASIWNKFRGLFTKRQPTPRKVVKLSDQEIRSAGLSFSKVKYIKDLSSKIISKEVRIKKLNQLSAEEVYDELIIVKGIGPWSVEMFLMFSMAYPDIFSKGDLGIMNGIKKVYKLSEKPTEKQLLRLQKKWVPYRSFACLMLWKSLEEN